MAVPCSSKHGPIPCTVLKNLFVWMLCSQVKTFKFMAGPRSPTSPVTAQFISQRWRIIFFWCNADFQQRSNQRLVVLPQRRSSSFHIVDDSSHLVGMKLFKNIRIYGLGVLPQTRPSSFHGVEEPSCVWNSCSQLKTFKFMVVPRSPTSSVTAQLIRFVLVLCRLTNNVQMNGSSCSSKHGPTHFTLLKTILIWMVWSFSTTFDLMAGPCYPKHGPVHFTVLKIFFVSLLCSQLKSFKFMAGPRSPTSPVTAQFILRRWRIVSFWCCADFQQRSKKRMVVLPQTRSSWFRFVEKSFSSGWYETFQQPSNL